MTFNEQSWQTRYQAMGDEAEGVFEKVWPRAFVRYGLNRPPISLKVVPKFIRYTPDYMDRYGLVECQGCGQDRLLKVKDDKAAALTAWSEHAILRFFLWDRTEHRWCDMPWEQVVDYLKNSKIRGEYHEGNKWTAIHVDRTLDVEWHDHS